MVVMILTIALVIIIFSLLVFVHEIGHFAAAKRAGVAVEEFGFGFPPRLYGRRRGGTIYSINALPLGGFVRLRGESLSDRGAGSFGAASFGDKTKILLAGVAMNALLAYVILLGLCLTGLPPILQQQFSVGQAHYTQPKSVMAVAVESGSPAAAAGIKRGDLILSGDGQKLTSEQDLLNFTKGHAGQTVNLQVAHHSQSRTLSVHLRPPDSKNGFLGVTPFQTYKLSYDWLHAPVVAAGLLVQLVWGTLLAFGGLVVGLVAHGRVSDQVAGPVGITVLLSNIVNLGWSYVLVFVASISVSLAVINALPLPALDGGRWLLAIAQRLTGRPLSAGLETAVHAAGFAMLMLLMVIVTVVDIQRLKQ